MTELFLSTHSSSLPSYSTSLALRISRYQTSSFCSVYCFYYAPPPYGRGALSDTAIHLSVCLSHGAAVQAIGMLAACSLATAGHQRCADCGPDGRRSAAVFATVELPSAGRGAYCISAPGATPCLTGLFGYIFHRQLCSCGRKWDIQWHV